MTFYNREGPSRLRPSSTIQYETAIPAGTYTIKRDDFGFFFELIDDFELPKKTYGDLSHNRDRILTTFMDRPAATGVMLAGEKGSGKTLLAKAISVHARETLNVPTIVVNTPWCGEPFNTLIQEIEQPCVILFDEFEKVYDSEQQEAILTLLDGVYPTKKLFIITTNDKWRVDTNMRNRPGRVFYMLDFDGLTADFIREYANDNLNDKSLVESIVTVATLFAKFNFDTLKALVEEMNRYKETAQQAMRMLNAKPEFEGKSDYDVRLFVEGKEIPQAKLYRKGGWCGNPITNRLAIEYYVPVEKSTPSLVEVSKGTGLAACVNNADIDEDEDDGDIYCIANFGPNDIKRVDSNGTFTYKNEDGEGLILTKREPAPPSYWDAL